MDSEDMDHAKVFKTIEQELRSQYVLGFTLPEADRDGQFHKLELRTRQRGVTIRARRGYQAAR